MFGKKYVFQAAIIIIILSTLFQFENDSLVKVDFTNSYNEIEKGKIDPEIINSATSEVNFNKGDLVSQNSDNKSWTYMLYLDADNDIEGDAIRDFEWLEAAGGSDENISIVVLLDRIPGYDNTHGNWNGSKIYNITEDVSPTTIDSQLMVDLGEVDMANTATLTDFILYCFDNFTAENYILDLWNHGHAAYGVIDDESSSSHFIVNDVQTAISNALAASSEEIDIISMDACNMITLEVAWEMRNLCKYFIASEDGTNGYPYNLIAERLKLNPGINVSSLCELMVDAYSDYYWTTYMTCLSVINQTSLIGIPEIFNSFVSELITTLENGNYDDLLAFSREISYDFYDGSWVDFLTLIESLICFIDNPSLVLAAEELKDFLNQAIVYNWQHNSYDGHAQGVTIFMPFGPASEELISVYTDELGFCSGMDWQTDTLWDEFLTYYEENNFYTTISNIEILNLDEVKEDCSIPQNSAQIYRINLWQKSIYEFNCPISSGDIDIKIFEFDLSGNYDLMGGSYLVNPTDASTECCRLRLGTGFYLIFVISKVSASNYDLVVRKCEIENLVCNSPRTLTGGSMIGDEFGHFKQDLNHYFQIDMPYGNNTIILTNSEIANYQLTIYNEDWRIEYYMPAAGFGEILTLSYNHTSENPITFILEICGYEGAGEFTIEIKNPNEPTPKMTFYLWQFVYFIPVIVLIFKKRFKKSKDISY